MADPTIADPICLDHTHTDLDSTLPIPPLDPNFFDQDLNFSFNEDFDFDIEDLDFTLDDLYFPSDTEEYFPNFTSNPQDSSSSIINQAVSQPEICQATKGDQAEGQVPHLQVSDMLIIIICFFGKNKFSRR